MDVNIIALFAPNRVSEAALTGGSFNAAYPLSNAALPEYSETARTTDLLAASCTFDLSLPRQRKLAAVAIPAHNFTSGAQWRVRAYYDAAKTVLNYDSDLVDVWPAVYDSLDLEWEDDNFWTGQVGEEERESYQPLATIIFPETYLCQVVTISVSDAGNAAGYLEFGSVFLADIWQPTINIKWEAKEGFIDDSSVTKARSGAQYFNKSNPRRKVNVTFGWLTEDEAITDFRKLQRLLGITGELLWCFNPDTSNPHFLSRTFIGRFQALDDISNDYVDSFSAAAAIEEKV